jgi:2,2-dialkylglycine decarboxylase (pyruvate)
MPAAVALKQLDIVLRDRLDERAALLGDFAERQLVTLQQKYECVGDIRGKGLYRMLDIVKDRTTKQADPVMAERIRYNAALEGVIGIAVKHYFRFAPPLIVTEAEIQDIVGRLDVAIRRAMDGFPREVDVRESSSLSIGDLPIAAE